MTVKDVLKKDGCMVTSHIIDEKMKGDLVDRTDVLVVKDVETNESYVWYKRDEYNNSK